jgi:predicted N-acyltransferase
MSVCGYGAECSDHLGCLRLPILEPDAAELAAVAINRFCNAEARTELSYLDGSGEYPQQLMSIFSKEGRTVRLVEQAVCPAIQFTGGWDHYARQLSSNFRSQIRRHHKRIVNHDTVSFRLIGVAEADAFTAELIRLNRTRMQDKGDVSSLEEEAFREFLHEAVPYMAREGLAWMDVVESGGDTFGAALNFVHGDTVYYYMGGFAEDAKSLRPGTALFVQVIQRSIERGLDQYDFLRGAENYKYRWGATDVPTYQVTVYPGGTFRASFSRMLDDISDSGRTLIRRIRTSRKNQQVG